jgi:hypothetical protein
MKKIFLPFILIIILSISTGAQNNQVQRKSLLTGFVTPADTIQTSVYWYWISDNLSKEGVEKDLESMKAVGINRAFIGNIGLEPGAPPYGKVKLYSNEWWDILHAALKKAGELGIEIGIFNSPGWSQSGGPWVKPEQAMRYLAFTDTIVTGPGKLDIMLAKPKKDFQDVKVIAYPVFAGEVNNVNSQNSEITSEPEITNISSIADGNMLTEVSFTGNVTVKFKCNDKKTIRSISVFTAERPASAEAELYSKQGNEFIFIKKFDINRINPSLQVGFDPYGPVVISVPEINSSEYKIVFKNASEKFGIKDIQISSQPKTERYVEKSLAKLYQSFLPYWHEYMWPEQEAVNSKYTIDPSKVIDISRYMDAEGKIKWTVPSGSWKIVRSGMTPTGVTNSPATPEATGLETDKMSRKHIAAHFNAFLGEIIRRIPAEDRKTWKVVVEDSYEVGAGNWTDGFIEEFKTKYGYNPVPYIPALQGEVVKSHDVSDRFLWDLRRLVADKTAYDYVGGLKEVSNKNGLTTWLECYGHWGFPGEFLQYGGQSDEVGGEFWGEGDLGNIENRAASSCAHIYGKRKVSAESFTCGGNEFSRYPYLMKRRGDRFFAEGINNTLLHVYIHQPYEDKNPGVNAWFGNEFNRKNTWFYDMDDFIKYLRRCNYMLQQGSYVADAAYFIGEDTPKMTGVCNPPLPQGYSFDYINAEVILKDLTVKNGRFVLPSGLSYGILVLPELETMSPEVLKKINSLVKQGGVIYGKAPVKSPGLKNYPSSDKEVNRLAKEIWKNIDGSSVKSGKYGKGTVINGMDMQEALNLINIKPDCKIAEDSVLFLHRKISGGDIYFISNQAEKQVSVTPVFRLAGKKPESWDAVTGKARILPAFEQKDSTTVIPLRLEPLESVFIVFLDDTDKNGNGGIEANFPSVAVIKEIKEPWSVIFDKTNGGPVKPVTFNSLIDWTKSDNDSIKYFSGKAVYKTTIELSDIPSGKQIYLELGRITAIAKVKINGIDAGGVWTAPWHANVTGMLKKGINEIEISVTNNWMNRLIGDSRLPENQRITWAPINNYNPGSKLQPSGLFGPVKISAENKETFWDLFK